MMRRPRPGWLDLPRAERRAVIVTAILVPATHLLIRVINYRQTMALAAWTAARWPRRQPVADTQLVINQLRLATARVQRYSPLPGNCLSRSIVLWWRLRRRGLEPDLRLGVSLAGGTFAAHAWVEHEGQVLNDTGDVADRYQPLTTAPARQPFE